MRTYLFLSKQNRRRTPDTRRGRGKSHVRRSWYLPSGGQGTRVSRDFCTEKVFEKKEEKQVILVQIKYILPEQNEINCVRIWWFVRAFFVTFIFSGSTYYCGLSNFLDLNHPSRPSPIPNVQSYSVPLENPCDDTSFGSSNFYFTLQHRSLPI